MTDIYRTLILPAAVTPLAREIAATLSPAGAGMWTTGLSPTGAEPATHFISTGLISPELAFMVPEQTWEQGEACTAAGMVVTQAEVEAVFAVADVTEQEPFVAMGRMGLVLVQEPLNDA